MSSNKFSEESKITFRDFDPNGSDTLTNAGCSTAWIDMKDWHRMTVIIFRTVGTSKIIDAGLYTSAASTGTSAALVGSLHGSTNMTGLLNQASGGGGDTSGAGIVVLDHTHDEIAAALEGGRYVCARTGFATGTDEAGVIYLRTRPRTREAGLLATDNG